MSIELLLPAGNYEAFTVAVNNGADAVYVGGNDFSARANAVNFSNNEIIKAVKYAHIRGVKVYVALNTLIEDERFDEALSFARFCYLTGVDALIVQDIGLLKALRQCMPDFKLNASTQMTIHNLKGVKAAERAGFSRVVLSRELSRNEIGDICSEAKAEIEVFAHGALCMSYSGQCLMSSLIGGRSGNRGACAQPCRLPYSLVDDNGKILRADKYLLSLKDLCLLEKIDDLKKLGVKSLKIEGRMKNSEYVALTAHIYDKYRNGQAVEKEDIQDLQSVFSRDGFTDGYYKGDIGRSMFNIDKNNDDVYKNVTDKAKKRAERLCLEDGRKISVSATFEAETGKKARLCVWDADSNFVVSESSYTVEKARSVALSEQRVSEQILKTGGTPFIIDDLGVTLSEGISLPIKEINAMRRGALAELEECRCKINVNQDIRDFSFNILKGTGKCEYSAKAQTYEQIKLLETLDFSRIYVPQNVFDEHKSEFSSNRFFVTLPAIEHRRKTLEEYKNISVSNFSQIYDSAEKKHAGARLNVFNSVAVKFLKEQSFESVTLSPELNLWQIEKISKDIAAETVVYGYLPVMTVRGCVLKSTLEKCGCGDEAYYLKDRKGAQFRILPDKSECVNVILNSAPVYMADKMCDVQKSGVSYALMDFTVETNEEIENIYKLYKNGVHLEKGFTRGHFYRGV